MSYPALNQDMILEIFSYCPASTIAKFRFLNKDYYKRMSESSFVNLNLLRTNSIFGVFLQYQSYPSNFNSSFVLAGDGEVSLDFLPMEKVKIEACDPSQGILLCVVSVCYGKKLYLVCKPTTRQYRTIPTPETGYWTDLHFRAILSGLIVIRTNPLRYKIVKLSTKFKISSSEKDHGYTLICEVFDSDSFAWKRLDDVKLPKGEFLTISSVPVSNNRFLHWLTTSKKNVFRFGMETERWSLLSLPNDVDSSDRIILANHEGKLGIIVWERKNGEYFTGTWVLDGHFGKSWVNVKEEKSIVEKGNLVKTLWFPRSNDVVMIGGFDWIGLYDVKTNRMKSERFKVTLPCSFGSCCSVAYFPFYSDHDRLDFNEDDVKP
ncbi:unnamed protein product [Arabis nemorensis]|uniref:F-box associated beta-propeller type 1 domain-containing protein n=1 Tax=Arabis nemorensis TaxID=586526 RepID=A0A565C7G5_9BRAS|nr:unnamed protein product [Arabis nemorensis]